MTKEEKIEKVEEAQESIREAISTLKEIDDQEVNTYIVAELKIMLDNEHGFMTSDTNLEEVKTRLEEEEN